MIAQTVFDFFFLISHVFAIFAPWVVALIGQCTTLLSCASSWWRAEIHARCVRCVAVLRSRHHLHLRLRLYLISSLLIIIILRLHFQVSFTPCQTRICHFLAVFLMQFSYHLSLLWTRKRSQTCGANSETISDFSTFWTVLVSKFRPWCWSSGGYL